MSLYPLKFKPRFVEKIWGGRKLQTVLGKALPADQFIGESWELYDFPPGVVNDSVDWVSAPVANGKLAGRTLHSLVSEYGADLYGQVPLVQPAEQFPILIKYLDAREVLSVQVHPDEPYVRTHPGVHLKTEAWYIVQSDPGARIHKGVKPSTTLERFREAVHNRTVVNLINEIPVKAGQCHYLPSGTVHAMGAGILAAEVQTPSDTTFRVYDFDRVDPSNGKSRDLHIDEAMDCIDFTASEPQPPARSHVASAFTTVSRLVSSPYFTVEKVRFSEGVEDRVPYDQPVVWMMLQGQAELSVAGGGEPVRIGLGDTVLLPAALKEPRLKTLSDCVWLEVTFVEKK